MKYGLEVAIQEFAPEYPIMDWTFHTEFIGYTNSISQENS
jgi:hypothetical protein